MNNKKIRLTEEVILVECKETVIFKKGCTATILPHGLISFDKEMTSGIPSAAQAVYLEEVLKDAAFVGKYEVL